MGLGFGGEYELCCFTAGVCTIVSDRNFSYEQVYPFLGFPASSMDASSIDAPRTAFHQTAEAQG